MQTKLSLDESSHVLELEVDVSPLNGSHYALGTIMIFIIRWLHHTLSSGELTSFFLSFFFLVPSPFHFMTFHAIRHKFFFS